MRCEGQLLETVREAQGIPVPRLVASDFNRRIIDRDCMSVEKLSGATLSEVQEPLSPQVLHLQDVNVSSADVSRS